MYDYDIALAFNFMILDPAQNKEIIGNLKHNNIKLVQRIDGPGPEYSPQRQSTINTFDSADHVIFQSEYCRKFWQDEMGMEKKEGSYSIIHNGRNKKFPKEEKYNYSVITFCSYLNYHGRRAVTPELVFNAIPNIVKKIPNFKFVIMGEADDGFLEKVNDFKKNSGYGGYVFYNNFVNFSFYYDIRESYHVCWHLMDNDMCSNSVVECMSMGIPVIGCTESGTPELVGKSGFLINKQVMNEPEILCLALKNIMDNYDYQVKKVKENFLEKFVYGYNRVEV